MGRARFSGTLRTRAGAESPALDRGELDADDRFDELAADRIEIDELDGDAGGLAFRLGLEHADHARAALHDAPISGVEPQLEGLTRLAERPRVFAAQENAPLGEGPGVNPEEGLHGVELHPHPPS